MLSINTNLSSLIAQQSLSSSTTKLNQAIERMSTGFKINHAKDNAANYSISTNMSTQIGAYDVAANNVAMGMDLVTTASDIISTMQDHATRLQALSTQARNGTYGEQSMSAINSEAAAIMAEINRLYSTAEYNNVSLFDRTAYTIAEHLPQAGESGFIDETGLIATASTESEYGEFLVDPKTYTDAEVAAMTKVKDISSFISGQVYSISSAEELAKVATLVNSGVDTADVTFVLADDIDLSAYKIGDGWTPIGTTSNPFLGSFDGNGHKISNLTINRSSDDYQGLFGYVLSGTYSESTTHEVAIKNLLLENVNINGGNYVGALAGAIIGDYDKNINNCISTGNVKGKDFTGGLIGEYKDDDLGFLYMTYSYSSANVKGQNYTGGLLGHSYSEGGYLHDCYSTGNVIGQDYTGGIVGDITTCQELNNLFSTGKVIGNDYVGGLIGVLSCNGLINAYAAGDVSGEKFVGGISGRDSNATMSKVYSTGNVVGYENVGGLLGAIEQYVFIDNSFSTGSVTGNINTGGIAGNIYVYDCLGACIENCYVTGNIRGNENTGGFIGVCNIDLEMDTGTNLSIKDSVSYSKTITGNVNTGALVGLLAERDVSVSLSTLEIANAQVISNLQIVSSYAEFYDYRGSHTIRQDIDLSIFDENVGRVAYSPTQTTLQVGINSNESCQLTFDTSFKFDISAIENNIASDEAFGALTEFINLLSERSTQLGAVQNRLDSALESIEVNLENLVSSRSTIRDADIAEESSAYIRQQILQQASATLLATANQSPSIALQLI